MPRGTPTLLKPTLLYLLIAIVLTLPWLGSKSFSTRGEPREALVAQSMLRNSDWLVGSGYGGIVPSKPPLLHWGMAAAAEILGTLDEFSARLLSALAFIWLTVFFGLFLSKRRGMQVGLLSTAILLSAAEWFRTGVSARVDTLLTCLVVTALLLLYEWEQRKLEGLPWIAILSLIGGVLTKGPVALVLPAAIFGAYLMLRGHGLRESLAKCALVFVAAALVSGLWYAAAYHSKGEEFFSRFFYENVARFASLQEDEPHKHGLFYMPLSILAGFLPWTLIAAPALFKGAVKAAGIKPRQLLRLDSFDLFALLCVAGTVVFYSIPSSKRSTYALPAYPFLAYGLAMLLGSIKADKLRATRLIASGLAVLLLIMLVVLTLLVAFPELLAPLRGLANPELIKFIDRGVLFLRQANLISAAACAALVGFVSWRALKGTLVPHAAQALAPFTALLLGLGVLLNAVVFPAFGNALSPREFSSAIQPLLARSNRIYSFDYEFYGISFYLNRAIARFDNSIREGDIVLCYERDLDQLRKEIPQDLKLSTIDRSSYAVEKVGAYVLVNLISR